MVFNPHRREVSRFIHVDTANINPTTNKGAYSVIFGEHIPVQDYNNVIKIELKALKFNDTISNDYVFFKIKNIDGKIDSTSGIDQASSICYIDSTDDGKKPIYDFGGSEFIFDPMISKLTKLDIELLDYNGVPVDKSHSFVLKVTYIEGNFY